VIYFFQADLQINLRSFERILFNRENGIQLIPPIADYVRDHTDLTDKLLVWGGSSRINFMAQRDSPTAYFMFPLYVDSPITPGLVAGFYREIDQDKPIMVIDAYIDNPDFVPSLDPATRLAQHFIPGRIPGDAQAVNSFYAFIEQNYSLESVVDGYWVYRLNGSSR